MSDYRIKVGIRNARLLRAIEATGHRSVAAFAKAEEIDYQQLIALIGMRIAPITSDGSFSRIASAAMEALGALPQELWTTEQLTAELPRSTYERDVATDEVTAMIEQMHAGEVIRLLGDCMSPREEKIIHKRLEDDCTLEEVGVVEGVCAQRVRQIQAKAIRKMREKAVKIGIHSAGVD